MPPLNEHRTVVAGNSSLRIEKVSTQRNYKVEVFRGGGKPHRSFQSLTLPRRSAGGATAALIRVAEGRSRIRPDPGELPRRDHPPEGHCPLAPPAENHIIFIHI